MSCDHIERCTAFKETWELHKQVKSTPREQMSACLSSCYTGRKFQKANNICIDHGHSNTWGFFLGMGLLLGTTTISPGYVMMKDNRGRAYHKNERSMKNEVALFCFFIKF